MEWFILLLITAGANLLVPLILIISGQQLTLSQIRKIIIINGLCVWLIVELILWGVGLSDEVSLPALLWWFAAYLLMKKKCLKQDYTWEHIYTEDNADEDNGIDTQTQEKNKHKTGIMVLSILLAISLFLNVLQLIISNEGDKLVKISAYNSEKLEFYDENIVFVIDGYGDYYFTYDEKIQATRYDDNYEYWAYNKELAKSLGYTEYRH